MSRKIILFLRPGFAAVLAAIDSVIGGDHQGHRVRARRDAAYPDSRLRQRTSDGMPPGAEIIAERDPAARRHPDPSRLPRAGRDRADRPGCMAETGVAPG